VRPDALSIRAGQTEVSPGMLPDPFVATPPMQRKVEAFQYATVPNHARYRPILRYFYREHRKLRDWLQPAEVHAAVERVLAPYTIEECEADLDALARWGNLQAEHDLGRAKSLAEFYRPRLVYHITPFSVDVEALLEKHESDRAAGGALNATLLERVWSELDRLQQTLQAPLPTPLTPSFLRDRVEQPWSTVYAAFTELRDSAVAYHHTLSAARPADLTNFQAFLVYKDTILEHLKGFIGQLQTYSPRLRTLLDRWHAGPLAGLLVDLLTEQERVGGVSRLSGTGALLSTAEVRAQVYAPQLRGLAEWFAPGGGGEFLMQATATAILQIVRQNERIATRHEAGLSRRRDLERLARTFAALELNQEPLEVVQRLAARTLGAALPRHLRGATSDTARLTDRASVWEQVPQEFALRRVRRGRPHRERTSAVADVSARQAALLAAQEAELARERTLWNALFASHEICIDRLEIADPLLRMRILDVLQRALLDPDHAALASDGRTVRVTLPDDEWTYGELLAPDGVLVMPALRLSIEPGDVDSSAVPQSPGGPAAAVVMNSAVSTQPSLIASPSSAVAVVQGELAL